MIDIRQSVGAGPGCYFFERASCATRKLQTQDRPPWWLTIIERQDEIHRIPTQLSLAIYQSLLSRSNWFGTLGVEPRVLMKIHRFEVDPQPRYDLSCVSFHMYCFMNSCMPARVPRSGKHGTIMLDFNIAAVSCLLSLFKIKLIFMILKRSGAAWSEAVFCSDSLCGFYDLSCTTFSVPVLSCVYEAREEYILWQRFSLCDKIKTYRNPAFLKSEGLLTVTPCDTDTQYNRLRLDADGSLW